MIDSFQKDLMTGSYDLVALHILGEGPTYVYGMVRRIAEESNHRIRWREGTAYRVLHDLERRGFVRSQWHGPKHGRQRRYYQLTGPGRRALAQQRRQWNELSGALNHLLRQK